MNKKVISSVLAGAMALSTMGVVASAADNNTTEGTNALSAKASLMEATINANIPAELETFINPYGAQVSTTATDNVESGVKYSDGIISPTYKIENKDTGAGLKINATAKITASKTVAVSTKLVDEAKLAKMSDKQVFAFLNTTVDAATTPVFADTKYVGNEHQVVFTEDGTKANNIMSLDKSGVTGAVTIGYFYVGGQCTPNPETAWDSKDTVTIDLVFDLSPSAGAAADLSLASLETAAGVSIEKEFDGTKKTYTLAAKGSGTKLSALKATAQMDPTGTTALTKVLVKLNGKFISATQAASASAAGATITAGVAGTSGASATIQLPTGTDKDFKAGDTVEFIVVNGTTNESATYTIIFE